MMMMGRRRLELLVATLALINCRTAAKIIVEGKTSKNIIINKYFIQMCSSAICVYVCTSTSYKARKIDIYIYILHTYNASRRGLRSMFTYFYQILLSFHKNQLFNCLVPIIVYNIPTYLLTNTS